MDGGLEAEIESVKGLDSGQAEPGGGLSVGGWPYWGPPVRSVCPCAWETRYWSRRSGLPCRFSLSSDYWAKSTGMKPVWSRRS